MRKICLVIFMTLFTVLAYGCGNNNRSNETFKSEEVSQTTAEDNSPNASDPESEIVDTVDIADTYVASFYQDSYSHGNLFMVTESGVSEDLGTVDGYAKYTNDGKYVIWQNGTRAYKKQPGKSEICISENAYDFYLNKENGILVVFGEDGIYATHNIAEDLEKISDLSLNINFTRTSDDENYLAVVSTESALYLIDLNSFSAKLLVSKNVRGDRLFICRSATEIYYADDDNNIFCWDGTTSVNKALPDKNDYDITIQSKSPNGKYAVTYENGKYNRCLITETGLTEQTVLNAAVLSWSFVSDDGIVGSGGTSNEAWVYADGTYYNLNGRFGNGYFKNAPPCVGNTVYYINADSDLIALDVSTGESSKIAENISYFHVLNGFCYYVTDDENKSVYRVGIEDKLGTKATYSNSRGFMY